MCTNARMVSMYENLPLAHFIDFERTMSHHQQNTEGEWDRVLVYESRVVCIGRECTRVKLNGHETMSE